MSREPEPRAGLCCGYAGLRQLAETAEAGTDGLGLAWLEHSRGGRAGATSNRVNYFEPGCRFMLHPVSFGVLILLQHLEVLPTMPIASSIYQADIAFTALSSTSISHRVVNRNQPVPSAEASSRPARPDAAERRLWAGVLVGLHKDVAAGGPDCEEARQARKGLSKLEFVAECLGYGPGSVEKLLEDAEQVWRRRQA